MRVSRALVPAEVAAVVLVRDAPRAQVEAIIDAVAPDVLQFHGGEDDAEGRRLRQRGGGRVEFDQRKQDQADADQHAADIARPLHRLAGEIQRDADGDAEPPEPA